MLYTIKDSIKYVSYYNDEDFARLTNKFFKLKNNNDKYYTFFETINALDEVLITSGKNIILTLIDKIQIPTKDNDSNNNVIFYKFLYDGKLMWIDSYYVEEV